LPPDDIEIGQLGQASAADNSEHKIPLFDCAVIHAAFIGEIVT
jgi:hypothetical protein